MIHTTKEVVTKSSHDLPTNEIVSDLVCSECAGTGKPVSKQPCICDGIGTQAAELQGLRKFFKRHCTV